MPIGTGQVGGQKIVALSNTELIVAFLAHEEQLSLLQQDSQLALSLQQPVKDWQKLHKPGSPHPDGSCSVAVARCLLNELTKTSPPSNFERDTYKTWQRLVDKLIHVSGSMDRIVHESTQTPKPSP